MKRISTDAEYLDDGKVVIDADGIPVELGYRGTGSQVMIHATHTVEADMTIIRGVPDFSQPGRHGTAFGGNAAVKIEGLIPEISSVTIECWFKSPAPQPSGVIDIIWGTSNAPYLGTEAGTGRLMLSLDGTNIAYSPDGMCDGQWHHVAVTLGRSGGRTSLVGWWIDGITQARTLDGVTKAWQKVLTIRGRDMTGYDMHPDGLVDEVRVSRGPRYSADFTPPSPPFSVGANVIFIASMDGIRYVHQGEMYLPRPLLPDGAVTWIGPVAPADPAPYDRWVQV